MEDFAAFDFEDFRKNYLIERSLDKNPAIRLGELSRLVSKANADAAHALNSWASKIVTKADRYAKKLEKRNPEASLSVRYIPAGDASEASIIVVKVGTETLEAVILDNNRISIKMSDKIAKTVNKGRKRKFLSNKDKVAEYIVGVLEKMA
jgi:hypothetical protein